MMIMEAEHYLSEGNPQAALHDLQNQIRNHPENCAYRIFMFQLLAVLGQWGRALSQLKVVSNLDRNAWPMLQIYQNAIQCEAIREAVFAGRRKPMIFGEPSPWIAWLLESLRLIGEKQYREAITLREKAFELAEESAGAVDEQSFHWIADADARLGPVLEMILNGRYFWAPFHQIRSISITPASDLRDLVWLPAQFTWVNGGEAYGLIPVRYPGSESTTDGTIQLARKTEWVTVAENLYIGMGQRMFATDQDEYPLLDIRHIAIK